MKDSTIENLAYLITQAKKRDLPKPIVFLGAGASRTGGIPLAPEISADVLSQYPDNPRIKKLKLEDQTYPKLMECLEPFERNELLKGYIDRAKINVTHIYLAQLLKEGYVDYVLTVNFDNLMLRALALYNEFPPTYDMAILKDLTTTNFKEKSVLYLHGQHHGLWLLNTVEEMDKVKEFIPPILKGIADRRPWIFIGYSGEDPIFNHVVNLGRFDNGLYWVCYKDNNPGDRVSDGLLDKPLTNTFIIKGYDSDSFMLKLNEELGLPQPPIIEKPFTSLKQLLENIVDINEDEHFRGVKERLEIAKSDVENAIKQFEEGVIEPDEDRKKETEINRLKREIIAEIIKEEFDEAKISSLVNSAATYNDELLNESTADLFLSWGNTIHASASENNDEGLYRQSLEKWEKAAELNPQNSTAFFVWGTGLAALAKLKSDEDLYRRAFLKYERAAELNPRNDSVFYNWGTGLSRLAKLSGEDGFYHQAIEKYEKATKLNPNNYSAYDNWGEALMVLAKLRNDEGLYDQAFEKLNLAAGFGGKTYNLACLYALRGDRKNALKNLETSLSNRRITKEFVENDADWKDFTDDPEFISILENYGEMT